MLIHCEQVDSKDTTFWIMLTFKHTYNDTPYFQRVYCVTAKKSGDRWTFDGLGAPLKATFDICNSYAIDRDEARKSIHRWAEQTEQKLKETN